MHDLFGRLPVDSKWELDSKAVKAFLKKEGLVVFWEHGGVSAGFVLGDEDLLFLAVGEFDSAAGEVVVGWFFTEDLGGLVE
jgi:hypothetical protein